MTRTQRSSASGSTVPTVGLMRRRPVGGRVDDDPGVHGPAGARDLAHDELGQVAGEVHRREPPPAGTRSTSQSTR
ncbi:hypothetical protein IU11_02470 [Cellulosimicrobium sp. MM]|nr:hypothetical protein IU11_02470 [Cellulosimicrobium sp. MM]